MKFQHILLVLLLSLISSASTSARTAKILYLKANKTAPQEAFLYQVDKEGLKDAIKVPLPKNNFSKTIDLEDGDTKLYFLPSELTTDDEKLPADTPSVSVPAAWSKVLIFAHLDPSNNILPIRFNVINAGDDKLGTGDLLFINSSDSDIHGTVGSKKLSLKSKSTEVISDQAAPEALYRVKLNRLDKKRNISVTFIRQKWPMIKNSSAVVFVYNQANSNRITYYTAPVKNL